MDLEPVRHLRRLYTLFGGKCSRWPATTYLAKPREGPLGQECVGQTRLIKFQSSPSLTMYGLNKSGLDMRSAYWAGSGRRRDTADAVSRERGPMESELKRAGPSGHQCTVDYKPLSMHIRVYAHVQCASAIRPAAYLLHLAARASRVAPASTPRRPCLQVTVALQPC